VNDLIAAMVADALCAPTVENCQEWQFHWDGRVLTVSSDEARGRYFQNHGNTPRLISLGLVLGHLAITAAARGLRSEVTTWRLAPSGPVSVEMVFAPGPVGGHPLHDAITRRYVDRRAYAPSDVPDTLRAALTAAGGAARVGVLERLPPSLVTDLRDVELAFVDDGPSRKQLLAWTRLSRRAADRTGDGIYWRAWDLPLMALLSMKSDWLFGMGKRFGAITATARVIDGKLASSHLACFALPLAGPHADNLPRLVELGQAVTRVWLTLVRAGYVAQPFSLGPILHYFLARDMLTDDERERFEPFLARVAPSLRDNFALPQDHTPMFLLRFGHPPAPYPDAHRTRRLSLDRVLHASPLPASPFHDGPVPTSPVQDRPF
jgi:hypothetical protein